MHHSKAKEPQKNQKAKLGLALQKAKLGLAHFAGDFLCWELGSVPRLFVASMVRPEFRVGSLASGLPEASEWRCHLLRSALCRAQGLVCVSDMETDQVLRFEAGQVAEPNGQGFRQRRSFFWASQWVRRTEVPVPAFRCLPWEGLVPVLPVLLGGLESNSLVCSKEGANATNKTHPKQGPGKAKHLPQLASNPQPLHPNISPCPFGARTGSDLSAAARAKQKRGRLDVRARARVVERCFFPRGPEPLLGGPAGRHGEERAGATPGGVGGKSVKSGGEGWGGVGSGGMGWEREWEGVGGVGGMRLFVSKWGGPLWFG